MSLPMTPNYWDQQSGQMVDDIGLVLVTLVHPDLSEPLRCVSLDIDVRSRGEDFIAWPMVIKLPTAGTAQKRGTLTIEAVDPRIGEMIRGLQGEVSLLIEYVSRDDPDDLILDQNRQPTRQDQDARVHIAQLSQFRLVGNKRGQLAG